MSPAAGEVGRFDLVCLTRVIPLPASSIEVDHGVDFVFARGQGAVSLSWLGQATSGERVGGRTDRLGSGPIPGHLHRDVVTDHRDDSPEGVDACQKKHVDSIRWFLVSEVHRKVLVHYCDGAKYVNGSGCWRLCIAVVAEAVLHLRSTVFL